MNKVRGGSCVGSAVLFSALIGALYCAPALGQGAAPAGKAAIVIFRNDRTPVAASVPVSVNAQRFGELKDDTFTVAIVNPGKVFLRAGGRILSSLTIQAAANRSYFVQIQALPGLAPVRTQMRSVSEASARAALAKSQFVGRGAEAEAAAKRILGGVPAPAAVPTPAAPRVSRPKAAPPQERVVRPAVPPAAPPRAAPPSAAPPRPAPPPAAEGGWDVALIVKGGAFKLSNETQVVGGVPTTYELTSRPAAGLEAEWRSRDGLAIGGEAFYYKNKLNATGTPLTGEQTVVAVFLNGKYYFPAADWFYPFVGVGIGAANSTYSGDLTGKASGPAYQGMAGTEFRFGNFGLYLQFKYLASTTDDGAGEKVKVGGKGAFAGVSLIF